ncbi:MAG: MFS transporter, partial [Actinomycetes bacterium]
VALLLVSVFQSFAVVIVMLVAWSLAFAAAMPVRQAYLNSLIPSQQRATVLSFDSLLSSGGGVVVQPGLGRVADVWGYPVTFALSAGFQAFALPFLRLAQRLGVPEDFVAREENQAAPGPSEADPTR